MSWFSKIKSLFSSDSEIEEETQNDVEQAFLNVCTDAGLGSKILDQTNGVELFKAWYEGDGSEQDILESIPSFMESHPVVNAKFTRFFKR
jgi:hypothetical protein|tara:strand:+ start:762 stop:1031 length:270 start_codon:yes stop_codon:yes gene_type:complete